MTIPWLALLVPLLEQWYIKTEALSFLYDDMDIISINFWTGNTVSLLTFCGGANTTGNRRLKVSKKFLAQREISLANITSPSGIVLRLNRSIQAEGAFAVMKENLAFRRFLTRGQLNISTEFLLLCLGFNINKLHSKTISGKLGFKLYKEELLDRVS